MSLRFFADHCVPNSVVLALRNAGQEVLSLREHLPTDSDDRTVIAKAEEMNAILISLDGDFADIVAYPPSRHNGIVALQARNRPESIPAIMRRLIDYTLAHPEMQDHKGRLLLVEPHRIRVRE